MTDPGDSYQSEESEKTEEWKKRDGRRQIQDSPGEEILESVAFTCEVMDETENENHTGDEVEIAEQLRHL